MKDKLHVLAIAGSLRRGSFNQGLIRAAEELLPSNITVEMADITTIPLFNIDLKEQDEPASVVDLKQRIANADALLIATPEYNASIPGVLKNAIDWVSHPRSQSPLVGKPLAILGAGGRSGTRHAQRHLSEIAEHLNMRVLNNPQVLVDRAWEKFDTQGNLIDQATRWEIVNLLNALVAMIAPQETSYTLQISDSVIGADSPR
jgi:chromate reductase, NAD(P)H dehydrogenase (quinone)